MVGRGSGDDGDGRRGRGEDDPADDDGDEASGGTLHGWSIIFIYCFAFDVLCE